MSVKSFNFAPVGVVDVYKRRGTKRVNLRVVGTKIRVTQPTWLPYKTGLQFANKNKQWIISQLDNQPRIKITNGQLVGKDHRLVVVSANKLRTSIKNNALILYLPANLSLGDDRVIKITKNAFKRVLKKEAIKYLKPRLAVLASEYHFSYSNLVLKSLKTRWGRCNTDKTITLNIYLLMLPWELIDYVLIHELVHTQHMHHGADFWHKVSEILPDYKSRRKDLKTIQHSINLMH